MDSSAAAAHGFGTLSYDMAHLLGGAALVLSFGLLYQRRIDAVINLYGLQAMVLAAAAIWQGWVQDSAHLYLTGAITLAAKGVAIPVALHRIVERLRIRRAIDTALGVFPTLILGVALVALAILVVLPTAAQSVALAREDLALALSVVLLGLLMMITRRSALTQVIGFLSLENGLILAAVAVPGLPMVVELSSAVLVLVAAVVAGVFFLRIRERFDSLDVTHLDEFAERQP
jgi:hydrogenase-4 component E